MTTLFLSGFKRISCLAIAILTLWLSGLGCALCCSIGVIDPCCTSEGQNRCGRSSEAESDCCKRAEKQCASASDFSISPPLDASCSLLPNQTPSLIRLPSATSLFADALPVHVFSPKLDIAAYTPVYAVPALPANRGSTYLRCCVLLI
jgi:hypothetical protein